MEQSQTTTLFAITEAMVNQLHYYLMGNSLYHQMLVDTPGGTQQPVMTLGALLEDLEALRARAGSLTAEQNDRLARLQAEVTGVRRQLPDQWRAALRRELKALLGSWKWSLDDAERDPSRRESAEEEAPRRSRLEIIRQELAADQDSDEDWRQMRDLEARQQRLRASGKR